MAPTPNRNRDQDLFATGSNKPISRRRFLKSAAFAASAAILAACGGTPAGQSASTPSQAQPAGSPAPAAAATAPAASGAVQIHISYPDEAGKKPKYVDAAAADFNKAHTDGQAVVDLQKIDSDSYYTKLLLALGTDSAPDVFHVSGGKIAELADGNLIAPLDDYLKKWDGWQHYPDAIKAGATYKGKVWAIPYGLDTRFLYYRKDVFQQAGLPQDWQPKKVQDIIDAAKAVQAKVTNVIPYVLYGGAAGSGGTISHGFLPLVWAYGGELQNQDGKWIGSSPAILKALQYYQEVFVTDKLVPAEVLTLPKPWTTMREKLGKGELAMLFEGGWVRGGWTSQSSEAQVTQTVGTNLFPYDNGSGTFTVGGLGTCWFIADKSQHKDLAWDFIARWNNPDTVAKLNLEDPHPVARTDAAEVPEFKQNAYLTMATQSLEKAKFEPMSSNYAKVQTAIQQMTGRVASGESPAEQAMLQFVDDLKQAVGDSEVVTQS